MLKRAFDIIGWAGTALVLVAVAIFFAKPEWQQWSRWLSWAGLVCILVYGLGQWREIGRAFAGRQARLGTISVLSVAIVLGILAAVNYISYREHRRWDLTATGQFTLSPQTQKVLQGLNEPLKMTVFARESEFPRFRERLPQYEYASRQVQVEYVDPDKRPALAREMQIQSYGTVAIEYQDRIERVTGDTEQSLTNGIIKVVTGEERKVYFTQGHGEKDPDSAERTGYNAISAEVARDNYKLEKLVLAQQPDVPADATVVVVAGPRNDFLPSEIEALERYLARGGKLLLMLDPPAQANTAPLSNLIALAYDWGIEVGNSVVVDVSGVGRLLGTSEEVPVAASYPTHPIVADFALLTAFPLARPVSAVTSGVNNRFAQAFVETSPNSWAETDVKTMLTGGELKFEENAGDRKGPITIAAAVSAAAEAPAGDRADQEDAAANPETRVVVFGDSDFASNFSLGIQGNRDLFMNTLGWLSQQENLISIRPTESEDRRITMTSGQQTRILILVLAVIPLFVLGTGVYTWWRRR
ncbi:MAG TPA: Gldg family protein [Vicinamibacterales bacterium]|nr:Gldg family protein [Vicinamibacterales bacterium]